LPSKVYNSSYGQLICILTCLCYQKRMSGDTQTAHCCHATVNITVMVRAWSCSFQRTIIGRLQQSLWWWPPHHCSVPPLPPATLVGLILDLRRNSSSTLIPPKNLHSYHCHYQPAPCAIYRSTTRAPPRSTHIPCHRPIILCTHQFSRSLVLVATRTCQDLSQHPSASFGVQVFLLYVPFCSHMLS